jgi:hypothetical protein
MIHQFNRLPDIKIKHNQIPQFLNTITQLCCSFMTNKIRPKFIYDLYEF